MAGNIQREPVDLSSLKGNMLQVLSLDGLQEEHAFIGFATQLDDGEAETCATATLRGFDVIPDDRKVPRILTAHAPQVGIHMLKAVLQEIRERSDYFPASYYPYKRC